MELATVLGIYYRTFILLKSSSELKNEDEKKSQQSMSKRFMGDSKMYLHFIPKCLLFHTS